MVARVTWQTMVFATSEAWIEAGRPIGGIFPSSPSWDDDLSIPDRYRGVQMYYVALPNGQSWCPWKRAFNKEKGYHGEGWEISGEIPARMTVTPSIDASPDAKDPKDRWHGWLTDGELRPA
jgi:hypothetical protein